jgi:hypothetical protein
MMETPRPELKPLLDAVNAAIQHAVLIEMDLFAVKEKLYDMGAR